MTHRKTGIFSLVVLVAGLGYFVDVYDLLLFSIIRVPSLKSLGLSELGIRDSGETILSIQMFGLLLGGIGWGILGDKKGRRSVLFGSILLYSLANVANGFVQTTGQYELIRFLAGLGLAGELGAGITLVAEMTPRENRGMATSMVSCLGLLGAVFAFLIKQNFNWRTCYFIGAGLGFALLLLRISVLESGLFASVKETRLPRGNLLMLLTSRTRLKKYLITIGIGLPTWLSAGVLLTFSKEFGTALHLQGPVDAGKSVMYSYLGTSVGGIGIGMVSQWLKSRKKALYLFYGITLLFMILFFTVLYQGTVAGMYWIAAGLGFGTGIWAIFVTLGAEQFGTNLRATAATTIPNMVRGSLPLMLLLFRLLRSRTDYMTGAALTSGIVMVLSLLSILGVKETFYTDLDFTES